MYRLSMSLLLMMCSSTSTRMSRTLATIPAARYLNGTGHGVRLMMFSQLHQLAIVRFAAYHPSNPGLQQFVEYSQRENSFIMLASVSFWVEGISAIVPTNLRSVHDNARRFTPTASGKALRPARSIRTSTPERP